MEGEMKKADFVAVKFRLMTLIAMKNGKWAVEIIPIIFDPLLI